MHVHEKLKCEYCLREVLLYLNRLSLMAVEPIICSGVREGQLQPETSHLIVVKAVLTPKPNIDCIAA